MDLVFLGTSSGIPTKQRNVSALALIEDSGKAWLLVDCGEATQHQLLHTRLSLQRLRAVLITHVHGDHCYGLPGLLASAAMAGRTEPLTIIAPAGIAEWIHSTQALTKSYTPFELNFIATEALVSWQDGHWTLEAIPLSHRVPSFAYRCTESKPIVHLMTDKLIEDNVPQGPLWHRLHSGQDVQYGQRTFLSRDYVQKGADVRCTVVCGDNDRPELLTDTIAGAQVLVHEATFTQDVLTKVGSTFQHSSAAMIGRFASRVGVPNLVLTHFSARYQYDERKSPSIADVRNEAEANYGGRLFLADDFAHYRLSSAGLLTLLKSDRLPPGIHHGKMSPVA